MEDNKNAKKDIKIVPGNGRNLEISEVHTHLPITKPKIDNSDDKEIVIPTEKKKSKD